MSRDEILAKRCVSISAVPHLMTPALHIELWISWASLLRSYAAAQGLHSNQFAVIEFSDDHILLRFGGRWVRFTHHLEESGHAPPQPFALNEDGTVTLGSATDEMDMAAERASRILMQP